MLSTEAGRDTLLALSDNLEMMVKVEIARLTAERDAERSLAAESIAAIAAAVKERDAALADAKRLREALLDLYAVSSVPKDENYYAVTNAAAALAATGETRA